MGCYAKVFVRFFTNTLLMQPILRTVFLCTTVLMTFSIKANDNIIIAEPCFAGGWSKKRLLDLKDDAFIIDTADRQKLALQLRYCLASADPMVRDEVAYQAYFTWLRAADIDKTTTVLLFDALLTDIEQRRNDVHQVYLPFAVLVLAEVVRVDRKTPYLSANQRQRLTVTISDYLDSLRDYRGFDEEVGWRHGIGHSADLMLQLMLNSQITAGQINLMLKAIAKQVRPSKEHFYIYGEPERLAMPVLYAMLRQDLSADEWQLWLAEITSSLPFANWQGVFQSQQGLAQRHNVKAFLLSLYHGVTGSNNHKLEGFKPMLEQALQKVN